MKVDRAKLKKSSSEVPADCKTLIDKLKIQSEIDLYKELKEIKVWTYGKCELYHWADVLDIFDTILEKSCFKENEKKWTLHCDIDGSEQLKLLLLEVLRFTALLIEHSFSRHLYNSMDHLTTLLTSCDMSIVLYVLNLLYVFSKRSNFIARMNIEKKQGVIQRLIHLAESWGGRENGFGLAECCQDLPPGSFPPSATTLHFEFYAESKEEQANKKTLPSSAAVIQSIHKENVDKTGRMPSQLMEDILEVYNVPVEKQVLLFTHIRLACLFSNYEARVHCVQARLQAISILVYSSSIQDNMNVILYPGLIEELVDIVEIKDPALVDIKSAALRTLTSVIHIERNPRLNSIIDATGASSYHGFLPVLVRTCIQHMIDPDLKPFPQTYATSLFSFLYHLANYENGVEALVSCGMMESLLKVINWYGDGQEHITFVTRAVRVIDLITNMDMAAFQAHGGLNAFINRLEHEVNICRKEQPFVIRPHGHDSSMDANPDSPLAVPMETSSHAEGGGDVADSDSVPVSSEIPASNSSAAASSAVMVSGGAGPSSSRPLTVEEEAVAGCSNKYAASSGNNIKALHCFAQRAALLKSMLNFLKKAIPDLSFAESIRHLMDGSLPKSLKHIISNAEYYGPSLFLLATDVVTVYVFQEPSLLSSLQDKGLTDVVLHALLIKDVPATREVLASLPNVFSALCLNARGLEAFVVCKPFDSLFRVLLSPDYLPAMRRRRSSDPFGDTASNLGNAMDELMRHQPSLRVDATKAIIKLLEEICIMGQDPHYICQKQPPKIDPTAAASSSSVRSPQSNEASSSDEEEEDEVEMPHMPPTLAAPAVHIGGSQPKSHNVASTSQLGQSQERQAIPLMDYVLNVMKFVEAILSNNSTADHCREFVAQKGLEPLMSILGLPNLPIDFPSSAACQAVSSACKSVLTLSKEEEVLKRGLLQMKEVLKRLEPLHCPLESPGGSVLLRELANAAHIPDATLSPSATPLLHALSAAHAYITMFVHVCRMGQFEIRNISVNHWGSELGLSVLKGLSFLYNSLVWESTVLLALCNEDYLPSNCMFGKADLEKLLSKDTREKNEGAMEEEKGLDRGTNDNGGAVAMDTHPNTEERMDTSESSPADAATAAANGGAAFGITQMQNPPAAVTPSASSTSIDSELLHPAEGGSSGLGTSEVSGDDKESKRKLSPAMQAQLRQLKPLLTLSSRLGRALSELFVLLVKLCVGSPVRMRRSQQLHPPVMPSPAARQVALALTKLLAGGLSFQPPIDASLAKLRMTFLVCSVGFTAPMLFDEKKHPFHLMLQKFVACGGQAALFQSFSWALSMDGKVSLAQGLEHPDLPEGTGEFLDSWLALVEKMINTKAVLESPHVLPAKGKTPGLSPFNPVQYLISTQKAAFNAVMNLWNKKPLPVHGSRMSESVFTILCHIIKGEAIIKKHLEKEKTGVAGIAGPSGAEAVDLSGAGPSGLLSASGRGLLEPAVNQAHLQQLMDMGFSREQASVALSNTTSVEQATEYILSNPLPVSASSLAGIMDLNGDENDEDQITRAIAMSLGETFPSSSEQTKEQKAEKTDEDTEEKQEGEEPLDTAVLDNFTQNIFPGCLNLLDTLPETVYRVCDLLIVVMQRNGPDWQRQTLGTLCKALCGLCEEMTNYAQDMNIDAMQNSASAQKFATRLHLLSLLAEEMNLSCSLAMQHVNLPGLMVSLLQACKDPMLVIGQTAGIKSTPRWLAPMLVLLDLWEKIAISLRRKMEARIAIGANRIWKWFDDSSGRWCKYSSNNNQTIDDAYRKGDSIVRFQAGRRKYSVQFGTMVQLNEETGNRRPVMLSIQTAEDKPNGKKEAKDTVADEQLIEEIRKEFEVPADTNDYLPCLPHESIEIIINCLSAFLSIPLNSDTLQAAMRLILRMTRQHQYAVLFVAQGGARQLLSLSLDSNFQGFLNLATLIFRHILEEPVALRYCMEKVMRNVCAGIGSCQSGVSQGGIGAQEMHYVLRVLGPAACRDPELFTEVARDTLQIALPSPQDEAEARYTGPNAPQILKCSPTKQLEALVNPSIKTFIWDLLNSLIAEQPVKSNKSIDQAASQTVAQVIEDAVSEVTAQIRSNISAFSVVGMATDASQQNKDGTNPVVTDNAKVNASQPLIPKSAILRLISEIIRSYGNCVQLITQYNYQPGQTDLVPDGCSVLAFVLDNLLPSSQTVGDKDCPALSRVFVASISSCSHSPDAQMALVTEVKAALGRALALQEGSVKHQRVQALASIINTMIEACPSPGQLPNQVFKGQQVINNNMIKSLVKKGVLVDLARIPHSLDLSSPFLATTINCVLKPLETLSRSVNSPDKFVSVKKADSGAGGSGAAADQGTGGGAELDQGGTTTQVVTEPPNNVTEDTPGGAMATSDPVEVSEMNVTIEDVTNDPEAQANLEMSSEHHIAEPQSSRQMNSLLSQLLGEAGEDREDQVLTEMTISHSQHPAGEEDNEILIDVEVEGDDDYETHDSQMVSQVLSDEDDDGDERHARDHDDNQDDVSGDDEDYDEAYQEETGDDDEDEEDEEEDEDEDEEDTSDMEGEGDEYQDTDDLVMMEDFASRGGVHRHIILNDTSQIQTYQLPVQLHDTEAGNEAQPSLPPAPSNITSTHPLLMRQGEAHTGRSSHRSSAGGIGVRQRVRPFVPTAHANLGLSTRQPNTPVILQRLLGESTAAEILQLTSSFTSQNPGGIGPTRVLLTGDNIPVIQRPDDDLFEGLFQEPFAESSSSGSGALSCIQSTLARWTEESKVLDGDGVHDLVTVLKPPLIEELVRKRDEAMASRKEERKKAAESAALDEKKKESDGGASASKANVSSSGDPITSTAAVTLTTSEAGTDEQRSTQAELLACAMVEQVFSPLVQSSVVASSLPAATTVSASSPMPIPSIDMSTTPSATLATGQVVSADMIGDLTPSITSQDNRPRSSVISSVNFTPFNPTLSGISMASAPTSSQGDMFTPHIVVGGATPSLPPGQHPPRQITQFSFLNNIGNAQGSPVLQQQQQQHQHQQQANVSGPAMTLADNSSATSSLLSIFPATTSFPGLSDSQPLILSQSGGPPAGGAGVWTPQTPIGIADGTQSQPQTAVTSSGQHGSMIIQLLDSIISDHILHPRHSEHATSGSTSSPGSLPPSQTATPVSSAIPLSLPQAPMPVRHIPWQPGAQITIPQRQLYVHHPHTLPTSSEPVRVLGNNLGTEVGMIPQQPQQSQPQLQPQQPQPSLVPLSVATSSNTHNQELFNFASMPVIQPPLIPATSASRAPPATQQFHGLDLAQDLSSIFPSAQQPFYGISGSGVTGATPPLSNLNFVTTTAASSAPIPTPISRDVGSSATSTTYSTTVTASSIPSSHPAEGSSGSVSTTGANNVAGPDVTPGATASQDSTGTLGDTEIPEGVDPSFLAALPEHIRQEVILEQLRLQRIRRRAQEQSSSTNPGNTSGSQPAGESTNSANDPQTMEVNPEFLAALPLAIQEEVLAQQRAEQARAQAAQQSAANPDLPVDPATFFSTLSTSLRQQVLADMDDSMLAVLPPELAAEAQELRRDMEERHRRILQERLFAQAGAASLSTILRHSGLANRLGNRYALRATRRNQWLSGGSRLNPGVQGGALGQSGKVKGRFMLDAEALTCLLVLLFIDEPKLNMSRLHRVLRNLCYHGPTRAWLIRALLSIVQRSGDSNSSSPAATVAANSLCIEGASGTATPPASGFKDKGKGKKSALSSTSVLSSSATTSFSSSSATSVDSVVSMQSLEVGAGGSSHPQHVLHQSSSSAAGGYWLSISLEAALGCRANVFQIYRASGGKRHASSSASATGSINIHPQAAPVVCRHAFDTLISLANVFPTYFLPAGKAKEVSRCEGGVSGAGGKEDELTDTAGRSNSSVTGNTGPQSSPKSLRPAEGASAVKHELRPENDFWNILLRLDSASGKSKGKGVQRCHSSSSSECEHLATDYGSSALGQLMLMLKHPVVRRSQLLTDRLLRLLRHISDRLPDITGRALATSAVSAATGVVSVQEVRRRLTAPPPVAPLVAAPAVTSVAAPVTTASSVASSQGSLQTNDQASHPTEGGTSTKETKKEETSTEAESDEDENPILYEQLKLAVEVLTSKSCSEEGLEDATRLLLQLSGANSATRAAVLELLLSGARQLGLAVCSHIQSLLEQLKELNARLCVDQVDEESSGESVSATGPMGLTSSGQTGKGMLQDRFSSGASVVVSAPTKLKTGRELQLPSMSQLTSKTSGQQFFLRILKVILQLRDAARSAGVKNKKSPSIRSRGRPGFEHIHAILNSVVSEDELLNFLGDNQLEQREIPIYHPQQQNQQHQPLQSSTSGNTQGGLLGMSVSTTTNQSSSTETPVGEAAGSQSQASQSSTASSEAPMEVDSQAAADDKDKKGEESVAPPSSSSAQARLPRLSEQLGLEQLWSMLGDCLAELARTPDHHAVLILQPAVEAFFIVHAGEKDKKSGEQQQTIIKREDQLAHLNMEMAPPSPSPGPSTALDPLNSGITMASITHLPPDTQKFLKFAETHRTVLNQILRQRTLPLAEGPFSVLVDYTRILDFDVKRRYFRQELERLNEGTRREDLPVHVRRSNVFEDSFRELFRRTPEEWKQRFYIVFEGEEGQDAGGLLREWYIIISHEIFNQNYALFLTSPGDRVTYSINPSSHCNSNHLSYFKFVGRIIAKAVYDNKLLDCYFTRSFYKHMLGLAVKYTDMESEDYAFYQGLVFLLENSVEDLGYDIYFSTEIQEFGVTETRELVPNGSNILVTDDNKREYVKLVCQMKMTGAIRQQLNAFLEGFYDIIPKKLVSIFTEQELELLISGLPTIDIDELKTNTEYHKYQATSLQIQWFWRALRSFDQAERANFLQFVTGTSKVPLGGFGNLEGMNGTQKFQIHRDDRSTDRLPSAHTCFNQLDLPAYETYDKLRKMLLLAISECSEGFGLA